MAPVVMIFVDDDRKLLPMQERIMRLHFCGILVGCCVCTEIVYSRILWPVPRSRSQQAMIAPVPIQVALLQSTGTETVLSVSSSDMVCEENSETPGLTLRPMDDRECIYFLSSVGRYPAAYILMPSVN
jgi:hypothetical protein